MKTDTDKISQRWSTLLKRLAFPGRYCRCGKPVWVDGMCVEHYAEFVEAQMQTPSKE